MASSQQPKAEAKKKSASKSNKTQGYEDKYDTSRTAGPDPRDPRLEGPPCNGNHQIAKAYRGSPTGSNGHAAWTGCEVCKLRLSYTPRFGAHALYRAAGALPADVQTKVREMGNDAAHSPELKDGNIALDGAEQSALRQLTKIREKKEAMKMKESSKLKIDESQASTPAPKTSPIQEMSETPGRKVRRGEMTAEELEFESRTDNSWGVISGPNSPERPQH